ncbi:MAG: thioredoxin family protein [Brevinematia bacterium]
MAVESRNIDIGKVMEKFRLQDPYGNYYSSDDLMGSKGLLVVFTCNHCPYARAIWPRLIKLSQEIVDKGINVVAINSNSANKEYPDDSVEEMIKRIDEWNIPFPYLVDKDQSVARSYGAECTPDIFLLDKDMKLFYHGRFDDNWKDINNVKKEDLKEACYLLIDGKQPPSEQYPSMGCSIKWIS